MLDSCLTDLYFFLHLQFLQPVDLKLYKSICRSVIECLNIETRMRNQKSSCE